MELVLSFFQRWTPTVNPQIYCTPPKVKKTTPKFEEHFFAFRGVAKHILAASKFPELWFLWLTAPLRQKATMLSRCKSEWLSECDNRIQAAAHHQRGHFWSRCSPIIVLFLFHNIVSCSMFVEDSFEWPRMLLRISMWSHKNSLICHSHVLSKLSRRLTMSTGGWVLFFIMSSNGT